ncbi:MAG: mitochondrial fission ELM1 family protein [Methylococcales bacterium]
MNQPTKRIPQVWVLMGHKAGDNNQLLALAEALEYPFTIKRMHYRSTELLTNLLLKTTLAGINKKLSSQLCEPWPDLVISAGRRNEPVAQWIKRESANQTKLIHVGRPWAALEKFDLIVTTPQYQLLAAANVLVIDTVLHRITEQRLIDAKEHWACVLNNYRKPYLAVLVGGNSGAYAFNKSAALNLAAEIDTLANSLQATVLISTSARTTQVSSNILEQSIQSPKYFFRWNPQQSDNPYLAFLAVADALIVTGESVSMLTEACVTGKPVYIYDFGEGSDSMQHGDGSPGKEIWKAFLVHQGKDRWRILIHKLAMRFSSKRMQRNISEIHTYLVSSGRAVWLGQSFQENNNRQLIDSVDKTVARINSQFGFEPY